MSSLERLIVIALFGTLAAMGVFQIQQSRKLQIVEQRQVQINELLTAKNKGKRLTYCDFIQHLQEEHGLDVPTPYTCIWDFTDVDEYKLQYLK